MNWNLISDGLPDEKVEVLLHWPVPGMPPVYRLGRLLFKCFPEDAPIWKFDLDCGDASATIFTNRGDEQPTHWAPLLSPIAKAQGEA